MTELVDPRENRPVDTCEERQSPTVRVFVDARCHCDRCTSRTTEGYRMVGRCSNCGVEALVLYRAGDKSGPADCPTCGVWRAIYTSRLATPDEIPVEYEATRHGE